MSEMTLRNSITAYLDEVALRRNPTTARTYRAALLGLVNYLEENAAVDFDTVKPGEVPLDLVVGYFKGLGRLSPSTIGVYFWAIYGHIQLSIHYLQPLWAAAALGSMCRCIRCFSHR